MGKARQGGRLPRRSTGDGSVYVVGWKKRADEEALLVHVIGREMEKETEEKQEKKA